MLSPPWKALPTAAVTAERTGSEREAFKSQKENRLWVGLYNEGCIQLIRAAKAGIPVMTVSDFCQRPKGKDDSGWWKRHWTCYVTLDSHLLCLFLHLYKQRVGLDQRCQIGVISCGELCYKRFYGRPGLRGKCGTTD